MKFITCPHYFYADFVTCPHFHYNPAMPKREVKILIIAAMKSEIGALITADDKVNLQIPTDSSESVQPESMTLKPFNNYWEPSIYKGQVGIMCCGVGSKSARKNLRKVLKAVSPQRVLIPGFAGSLNETLNIGDLVVAKTAVDSVNTKTHPEHFNLQQTSQFETVLAQNSIDFYSGTSVCTNRMIDKGTDRSELRNRYGGLCVEMEGYHLLKILNETPIPTSMVRVVSDNADESLGVDFTRIPGGKWHSRWYFLFHPQVYLAFRKVVKTALSTTKQLNKATDLFIQEFYLRR